MMIRTIFTLLLAVSLCACETIPETVIVDCPDPPPQLLVKAEENLPPIPPLGDNAAEAVEVLSDVAADDAGRYTILAGRNNDLIDWGFDHGCW